MHWTQYWLAQVVMASIERKLQTEHCSCYGCLTMRACDYPNKFVALSMLEKIAA